MGAHHDHARTSGGYAVKPLRPLADETPET